jgi:hypothetical protein
VNKKDLIKAMVGSEFIYQQQGIYSDSSGVSSPKIYTQGKFFSKQELISQVYLSNFENSFKLGPVFGSGEYMQNPANISLLYENQYYEEIENIILLPKPRKLKVGLYESLVNRVSSHFFDGSEISSHDLSDFLFYSAGCLNETKEKILGVEVKRKRRTYPSGGGMYSSRVFLCIYNVEGIEPGVYIYQPVSHSLSYYSENIDLSTFIVTERYDSSKAESFKIVVA